MGRELSENRPVAALSRLSRAKQQNEKTEGLGAACKEVSLNKKHYLERASRARQGGGKQGQTIIRSHQRAEEEQERCQLANLALSRGSESAEMKGELPGVMLSRTLQRKLKQG